MKKKLFFKLFIFAVMGALLTVTSCKDYDEDISRLDTDLAAAESSLQAAVTELNSLKTQIAAAATDTEVSQAVTAAKTEAIAAAKTEATNMLNTLKGGYTGTLKDLNDAIVAQAALITVLQGNVTALGTDLDAAEVQIAANKAAIALQQAILDKYLKDGSPDNLVDAINAVKADLAAANVDIDALSARIDAIDAQLNVLVYASLNAMVTSVDLQKVTLLPTEFDLQFSNVEVKANVFEENIANAITFVAGQIQSQTSFVIKVSPTNAEVTPEMISLQNSEGITYDNIEVVSVEPYDGLLTRSTNGGGLWKVTVQLKSYNQTAFDAATKKGNNKVLFAVAVNNTTTQEGDQPRKVISDYDITLAKVATTATMNSSLWYLVNGANVSTLRNRYGTITGKTEYTWSSATAVEAITTGTDINVTGDTGDSRTGLALYPAVQGQPIKITLNKDNSATKATPDNVRAMYVTLDKDYAETASAPSEINAWNSYSYTGLNTVVEGTETTITIGGDNVVNDVIGFRVYAVNIDGTLVDPDGKAFYVSVGTPAGTWPNAATVAIPESTSITNSAEVAVTLSKLATSTSYTYTWTADKADLTTPAAAAFNVAFLPATGSTALFTTATGATDATLTAPDFSTVKKIVAVPTETSWLAYKDGKVYNGTLTIKNATGHVITTMNVSFKKQLPTAAPTGFQPKAGQIINGVHTSFMIPSNDASGTPATTTDATHGTTKIMSEIFEFAGTTSANYTFSFANSTKVSGNLSPLAISGGSSALTVEKSYIDNSTEHATTVSYNFGKISTETKSGTTVIDYQIPVYNFKTVYSNIYKTYTWNWGTLAQLGGTTLPYVTTVKQGSTAYKVDAAHIYGVSTTPVYNTLLSAATKLAISGVTGTSAKLISNETNNEDYFTVTYSGGIFTFSPVTAVPLTVNVPSTLVITAKDFYNNDVIIRIPVTVTP